jgi:hypothetical protein
MVLEKLLTCSSAQDYEQLISMLQHFSKQEQELCYMLEARQAWEQFVRAYEERLTRLSPGAQLRP